MLLLLPGCGRDSRIAVEKGRARLEAGDYPAAARALSRATRRIRDSAPLYYNLGTAYHHMGRYDAAVSAFEAALRIDPHHRASGEHLGLTLVNLKDFEAAAARLGALLPGAEKGDRPRLLNALANAEKGAGRADLACLRYIQAERAAPGYAPTYYNLGCLYQDTLQLFSEATDQFEIYIRRAPADAHYAARQWARAEAAYARALAADYQSYDAAIRLGYARAGAGSFADAAKAFQRAGELAPGKIEPVYLQAHAAYCGRQYELAGQLLATLAIPRWPSHAASFQLMAYVRAAQKRFPEALIYGQHYLDIVTGQTPEVEKFRAWLRKLGP